MTQPTLNIPIPEPQHIITGTAIAKTWASLDRKQREESAKASLLAGNVPSHMRSFYPVHVDPRLIVYVLPDYLSIGTDENSLRMPLWPLTAQAIADVWGCMLPTTKIVTAIWRAAAQTEPQPWGPPYDASMMSTERFVTHNKRIDSQFIEEGIDMKGLVAGHKKDVVITNKLIKKPDAVAIFGWHRKNGKNIQPLYLGHEATYSDYSHSIRLISTTCELDGFTSDLRTVLTDPSTADLASDEGPLQLVRQPGC